MDFLILILGVMGLSVVGSAIGYYFMYHWIKKIIETYAEKTFNSRYEQFINRFVVLYRKQSGQIEKNKNDIKQLKDEQKKRTA